MEEVKYLDILGEEIEEGNIVFYCYKQTNDVAKKFGRVIDRETVKTYWGEYRRVLVVPHYPPGWKKNGWETDRPRWVGLSNMLKFADG